MHGRPIVVRGKALPFPAICAPLVGRTRDALAEECARVAGKRPDLIEWRVDFFEAIGDTAAVVAAAEQIRAAAGGIPVLFTRRHVREGGQPIGIGEAEVVAVYEAVCAGGHAELVDFEMSNDSAHVKRIRDASRAGGVGLVLSFHDFHATPAPEALADRFRRAEAQGADVAKVAVMPQSRGDVLALLAATARAADGLQIPVVSMSMGALGAVTRTCGWLFGSALTFAVGQSSSAPGQMAIEEVRSVLDVMHRASGESS